MEAFTEPFIEIPLNPPLRKGDDNGFSPLAKGSQRGFFENFGSIGVKPLKKGGLPRPLLLLLSLSPTYLYFIIGGMWFKVTT
jgi:hypothetical protein